MISDDGLQMDEKLPHGSHDYPFLARASMALVELAIATAPLGSFDL